MSRWPLRPVSDPVQEVAIARPERNAIPGLTPRPSPLAKKLDSGLVVALAWLTAAVVVTVLWGGSLGLRGWIWLGLHHLLCVAGCTHELRRAWQRRQAKG